MAKEYLDQIEIDGKTYDLQDAEAVKPTQDSMSGGINALGVGASDPVDGDYYVAQCAGGGTTITSYYRRSHLNLWNYIKNKIFSVLGLDANNYGGKAATAGYADFASDADTVDGVHASAFARVGEHNNLTAEEGNEFTFARSGFKGAIYINYRTAGGQNGEITDYLFCDGHTNLLCSLSTITSNASNGNTAYSWGNHATQGYLKTHQDISGKLDKSGGNMTGNIGYTGSKASYTMIKFVDNSADSYGNGIVIGGGGLTVIGGGESQNVVANQFSGGNEVMAIANDAGIDFYTNCQEGFSTAKHTWIDTDGVYHGSITGEAGSVAWYNITGKPYASFGTASQQNTVGIFGSICHSDYNNNQGDLITRSFMSYWNGSYNANGSSNLTYCAQGYIIGSNNIGSQSVNYATTAGSAPASDVYSWAKASSKPSYHAGELGVVPRSYKVTSVAAGIAPYIDTIGTNIFAGALTDELKVERSTNNGSSWTDVTTAEAANIKNVFSGCVDGSLAISSRTKGAVGDRLRITFNPSSDSRYCLLNFMYVYFYTSGCSCYMDIEKNTYTNQTSWTSVLTDAPISDWSGPNVIGLGGLMFGQNDSRDQGYGLRFTFRITAVNSSYDSRGYIYTIRGYTSNQSWGNGRGNHIATHNVPYVCTNADRAVTFDNTVTSSGFIKTGSSSSYVLLGDGGHKAVSEFQAPISDLSTIRTNASNGATAYGWGNHAMQGYLTSADIPYVGNARLEFYDGFGRLVDNRFTANKGDYDVQIKLSNLLDCTTATGNEQDQSEDDAEKGVVPTTKSGNFTFKFWATKNSITKDVFNAVVEFRGTSGGLSGMLYSSLRISFLMNITPNELMTASGRKSINIWEERFFYRPTNIKNKIVGKDVKYDGSGIEEVYFYFDGNNNSTQALVEIKYAALYNVTASDVSTMLSEMRGYLCLRDNR